MLIDALGAAEYWGNNANGDLFPEVALAHDGPDYGARTFEHYAMPYRSHVNKHPERAYGDKVSMARYFKPTGRVQLIVAYHNDKAADIIQDVDNGNYPNVSMGARVPFDLCFPAGTLIRTEDGHKSIESIKIGDRVLTHTGKLRRVTKVIVSNTEELTTIKAHGLPGLSSTSNHPYYILPKETMRDCHGSANGNKRRHVLTGNTCTFCKKTVRFSPDFVAAENVRPGDYVLHPVDRCKATSTVGIHIARLIGYYTGDGFIVRQRGGRKKNKSYKNMGVNITSDIRDQSHIDRVVATMMETGSNDPCLYECPEKNSVEIRMYDQDLAAAMIKYAGRYSHQKRLHENVFTWSQEEKRNFLGGYIDTDGSVDKNQNIRIVSVNRGLALDTQRIAHSIGIPASVVYHGSPLGFGKRTITWSVYIPGSFAKSLEAYSERVNAKRHVVRRWHSPSSFFFNGYWCTAVEAVSLSQDCSAVYNLSVDGDESYVAEGYAVHNCTICGNQAKTRANYCEHAKYQMNKILSDGRQVGVINTMPKFFDISVVFVGAEKASHILKKVAYAGSPYILSSSEAWDKLSGVKSAVQTKDADIDKQVPSNIPPSEQIKPVSELMDAASDVKNTEQTIPVDKLDQVAGFPMKEVFSTLAALGIPLKPHEFQRIMLIKMGYEKLAQALWDEDVVFSENTGDMPKNAGHMVYDPYSVNEKLAYIMRPYIQERSIYPEVLENRLFEKRAEDWYNEKNRKPPSSTYQNMIPLMLTMAGAYKMFKDRLPEVQKGAFERTMEAHPWFLPLLLSMGIAASVGARTALAPIQLHSQGPFDQSGFGKYGSEKSASWKRLGIIPAAYAYSGVQRHRAMQGEHLNWLDRKVAERPELAALGGFLAAPSVAKGLKRIGLSKGASAMGDLAMMSVASGPKFIPGVLAGMAIDMGVVKGLQGIANRRKRNANHAG